MSKTKETRSLYDYMHAKRRADCPVCQLPDDVREQLRGAKKRKIPRADQVEWLNVEVGSSVTSANLDAHYSGRHDTP